MSYQGELEKQLSEKREQIEALQAKVEEWMGIATGLDKQILRYAQYLRRDAINSQKAAYDTREVGGYTAAKYWETREKAAGDHLQQLHRTFDWLQEALEDSPAIREGN